MFTLVFLLLGCQQLLPMKRTISVNVTAPNPSWQVQIEKVYRGNGRLHVVSRLFQDPKTEMVAQVISQATDTVTIGAPDLPVQHHILGKNWNWSQEKTYDFVTNELKLNRQLANLQIIYERKK